MEKPFKIIEAKVSKTASYCIVTEKSLLNSYKIYKQLFCKALKLVSLQCCNESEIKY